MSNKNIDIWEDIFQNNEWGKYPALSVIKFVARNFYKAEQRENIKILEIGSGTGANLWFCAREGFSVYALEGSDSAINTMSKRFVDENLSSHVIGLYCGDYYNTLDNIDENSIDAIIDVESLYCNNFTKSKQIIEKCFSKLKVGGVMLSQTFTDGTYGIVGEEIDYHAVMPTDGPMGNKGFTRYTTFDDIDKLYKLKNNEITNIERDELHLSNGEVIKEWIIELRKI